MVQSSTNGDLNGIIAYLAPAYKINMKTAQGELSLTRAEYVALLNETWSAIRSYRVRFENQKVTVAPGKQKRSRITIIFARPG